MLGGLAPPTRRLQHQRACQAGQLSREQQCALLLAAGELMPALPARPLQAAQPKRRCTRRSSTCTRGGGGIRRVVVKVQQYEFRGVKNGMEWKFLP